VDVFDSFQIRGVDGITGEKSLEIANISLIVLPTNDAPIATIGLTSRVYSRVSSLITLTGTDPDYWSIFSPPQAGRTLRQARINSLPTSGLLYFADSKSLVTNTSIRLTASSLPLLATSPFKLFYRFTGTALPLSENSSLVGKDSFLFSVQDTLDAISFPVPFNIEVGHRECERLTNHPSLPPSQVISALGAISNSTMADSPRTIEATLSTIKVPTMARIPSSPNSPKIYGYDLSDKPRDLYFRITR
jgi:hypothetical protein